MAKKTVNEFTCDSCGTTIQEESESIPRHWTHAEVTYLGETFVVDYCHKHELTIKRRPQKKEVVSE
jgi:hypothetical protein